VRARRRKHLRLDLVNRQIGEANDRIDRLTERLADGEEKAEGQLDEQRDVTILRSLPGVGRIVLATLSRKPRMLCEVETITPCDAYRASRRSPSDRARAKSFLGDKPLTSACATASTIPAARRNHTNSSPQNASVTRKPTPLPGKRQTVAARLRPIARPASARALLSP